MAPAIVATLFLLAPAIAQASCFDDAAGRYGVDPILLKAISWQESRGHANAVGPTLRDGNVALGAMQINTNHLPELGKYGIGRNALFDGCTSVNVGAWILARCIRDVGATWNAVACYYAGPKSKATAAKLAYIRSVQKHYRAFKRLEAARNAGNPQSPAAEQISQVLHPVRVADAVAASSVPNRAMMVWGRDE
jgi:hypothetical protein